MITFKQKYMCYKSSLIVNIEFLEDRYRVKRSPKLNRPPDSFQSYHFNGFAHPQMLIIPQQRPGVISDAFWGLMPKSESITGRDAYYKKAARYGAGLNARSEKAFDHFLYRSPSLSSAASSRSPASMSPTRGQRAAIPSTSGTGAEIY